MRSIFSEKRFFEANDSLSPEAARLFRESPEQFLERTSECAKKAKAQFSNLPQDCPYRFDKVEKLPEDVKTVLENNSVSSLAREEREKEDFEGSFG